MTGRAVRRGVRATLSNQLFNVNDTEWISSV